MVNEEHLARLKQGVEVWNTWLDINRRVQPDLRRADLRGADLRGAILTLARLTQANLTGADLVQADLAWTELAQANFSRATLVRADLRRTHLTQANLTGANLTRADLTSATLVRANLAEVIFTEADLREATVGRTMFGDVDLSVIWELATVRHIAPSTIGIDTLYRSNGQIPEVFLRGAGVPEDFIPYIKSLVRRPFEFYSCFIGYSHADQSFARRLHEQAAGARHPLLARRAPAAPR